MLHSKSNHKISLIGLVLMIIAVEFGFSNCVTGYNQMGYASIIWYVLCSIVYLFPLAMIFAEYSGSIKNDHGGFYSWLINSIGERWAFIGTFMWVGLQIINLLQMVSGLGVHISGFLFGKDYSSSWHWGFLTSNEIEAIFGIIFLIGATVLATKGIRKIAVTATISGIISLLVIAIFVVISVVVLIANHGQFAQPIHGVSSFIKSPNPQFQSPIAIMSFAVYAMFAYGGIEASSGFIDKLKNPRKTFPKAMLIVAGIITALYAFGILVCGFATNWTHVMGNSNVTLYNNGFYLMNNLGVMLAKSMGWSTATGVMIGENLVRFLSIGALVPALGFTIVLAYSPVKGLIAGSSKDLWPKRITTFNNHDMPSAALWIECAIVSIVLMLVAITGSNGQQFYQIIVDMANIAVLGPYYFIVIAFVAFKKRKDLEHPIVFFHSIKSAYVVASLLLTVMTLAVLFNLITPLLGHQYSVAFWTFIGPILFLAVSSWMYHIGIRYRAKRMIADNMAYKRAQH